MTLSSVATTAALAVLMLWAVPQPLAAQASTGPEGCVTCHAGLVGRLATPAQDLSGDVHATRGFGCTACHGGNPDATEALTAKDPAFGYLGAPFGLDIVNTCARCHSDAAFMRRFNPSQRIDQATEYAASIHGLRLAEGDTGVATCVSCHSAHGIRQVNDPRAPIYPLNVAATCGTCHTDRDHMAGYVLEGRPFPTNQEAAYETSVHFEALTANHDLSAPTCNDCHGNHAAAPPGVDAVVNVCGTCHGAFAERFEPTTHALLFERGCSECHDNHAVTHAPDAMLGGEDAVCVGCHSDGDAGSTAARTMSRAIGQLRSALEDSERLIERARRAGMDIGDQELALGETRNQLMLARTEVHAFESAQVTQVVDDGLMRVAAIDEAGHAAMAELQYRRIGLAVSLVVILLFVVALGFKVRQLDERLTDAD